jgi:hypothetical protein
VTLWLGSELSPAKTKSLFPIAVNPHPALAAGGVPATMVLPDKYKGYRVIQNDYALARVLQFSFVMADLK